MIAKRFSGAGNRTRVSWVRATDANPYTTSEMNVAALCFSNEFKLPISTCIVDSIKGGGGGYQAYLFGNINFEIAVAQQGPYMYQHFGEVSGPWRPTGSEPRPALI